MSDIVVLQEPYPLYPIDMTHQTKDLNAIQTVTPTQTTPVQSGVGVWTSWDPFQHYHMEDSICTVPCEGIHLISNHQPYLIDTN